MDKREIKNKLLDMFSLTFREAQDLYILKYEEHKEKRIEDDTKYYEDFVKLLNEL